MRVSIALFVVGEVGGLIAIGAWSWRTALLLFSLQCIALGLLRELRAEPSRPAARKPAKPRHRRADRLRGRLRLIRGGVAS